MEKKKKTTIRLTSLDLRKFEEMLLAKRREILGDVSRMEDETLRKEKTDLSNIPFHMADVGSDSYETENSIGLMDSERRILMQIDEALGRIADGSYGICDLNGEPIPKARLQAIPWARYCVVCANLVEKGLVTLSEPEED